MRRLETERLLLRGWLLDDLDDLYEYAQNMDVGVMQGWKPHESKEESLIALNSFIVNDESWAIVLRENNKVIGSIKTSPDENRGRYYAKYVSYVLSADYWGKGYMTEALNRIIKYVFEELNIDLLSAFHYPHNTRSKRVLERCGFQYETTIKQGQKIYDGQVFDTVCYSILAEDYFKRVSPQTARITDILKKIGI